MNMMLMERDRLQEVLETLRLSCASKEQIRWHVQAIDERDSELERLRKLIEH